jgi:hypothetical protein
MLYPLLLKRILKRIRVSFEDFILNKADTRDFDKYEGWLKEYLELSDKDKENIVTKFERSQTQTIAYGMKKKDPSIFINQLGCFYIKPTTTVFYDAINRLIGDKNKDEYDFVEIKKTALEETRAFYIRRENEKKHGKERKSFSFKIQPRT